jgi:threonine aldolase
MDIDALRENIRAKMSRNRLRTALVWMETTHNAASGAVLPLAHMAAVCAIAGENRVPVHIDGARLFNAAVALGVSAKEVAKHSDSVCFCVSKGLSAPIGSLVCGTEKFIERARGFRRMVGGNLRQAGPIAAAGIVALETMVERLAEDHRTAKRLAQGLHDLDACIVDPALIETNLVRASVRARGGNAAEWSAALRQRGLLVNPAGTAGELRFVTHRHIGQAEVDRALGIIADTWKQFETPRGQQRTSCN